MDFGDILDEWDKTQKKEQRPQVLSNQKKQKKLQPSSWDTPQGTDASPQKLQAAVREPEKKQPEINPMELWLRRNAVVDKDALAKQEEEGKKLLSREYIKNMRPEAHIDLHGLTRDEALVRLEAFITQSHRLGLKKVLIIHGKGNHSSDSPVLQQAVRSFIERDKRLGASGHPDKTLGGRGATWVLLKY